MKRTKIVCTIGPASEARPVLKQMVKAGMNVARINFSHNTYASHAKLIRNIRAVAKENNQPIAILQDLQGPRIRIGELPKSGIKIKVGQTIVLVPIGVKAKTSLTVVPVQYNNLAKDLKLKSMILVEDGTIELQVVKKVGKAVHCKVKSGTLIQSHKGMNFPKSSITTPAITAKDKEDLKFGIKNNVDFVALSFVKSDKDVIDLRKLISIEEKKRGKSKQGFKEFKKETPGPHTETKIIAKIERPEAVTNFEKILAAVDGIMIARGDLGLEIPIQDMPLLQKHIIERCNRVAKPVIVATQMLDSMIRNPVPTRAEVTDVANAILDGTDAVMLSGESATGKYPVKAVQTLTKIANSVEAVEIDHFEQLEQFLKQINDTASSVSFSAQDIAEDIGAIRIVCITASGYTARSVVRFRPEIPVIALTPSEKTRQQLQLSWGVTAYQMPFSGTFGQLVDKVKKVLISKKLVKKGDLIVISASHPLKMSQKTNLVTVEMI